MACSQFVNILDKVDFRKLQETGTLFIWVAGGPGSGKTTLCTRLVQSFSFWHISVSELLNNLVRIDPKRGDEYTTLKKAKVIPTSIILFLIKQEMAMHSDKKGMIGK